MNPFSSSLIEFGAQATAGYYLFFACVPLENKKKEMSTLY